MPLTYQLDEGARTVVVVGEGTADVAQCEVVARALAADLETRRGWPILCDFRALTWVPWPAEVRYLATMMGELRAFLTGPIAVIIEKPATFGMARMLAILIEPFGLRMMPFRSLDEGTAWIAGERSTPRGGDAH